MEWGEVGCNWVGFSGVEWDGVGWNGVKLGRDGRGGAGWSGGWLSWLLQRAQCLRSTQCRIPYSPFQCHAFRFDEIIIINA